MSKPIATLEGKRLAAPNIHTKKGRHYVRLRVVGQAGEFATISAATDSLNAALKRRNELERVMAIFALDNPEATLEQLKAHLRDHAEHWLSQPVNGPEEESEFYDQLSDTAFKLRRVAAEMALPASHHKAIAEAIRVLGMAKDRLSGLSEPLAEYVESSSVVFPEAPVAAPIASGVMFSELVEDLLKEKRLTLKPASMRDLESSLRTVAKFVPDAVPMDRKQWVTIRDEMLDSGLARATINKVMTKAKMLIDYGLLNGRITGRNPIERLKLNDAESDRRPFTTEELKALSERACGIERANHRYLVQLGLLTGSRIGELVQLTPEDVYEEAGLIIIDINAKNGKSLKNANSARKVPLVEACGFNPQEFLKWAHSLPAGKSIIGMSRDTASKLFNSQIMPSVLTNTDDLSFHCFRHSLATECRNAGVAEGDAGAILGHRPALITYQLYGSTGAALGAMREALIKVYGNI